MKACGDYVGNPLEVSDMGRPDYCNHTGRAVEPNKGISATSKMAAVQRVEVSAGVARVTTSDTTMHGRDLMSMPPGEVAAPLEHAASNIGVLGTAMKIGSGESAL